MMDSSKNAAKMSKLRQYIENLGGDPILVDGWRCFEEVGPPTTCTWSGLTSADLAREPRLIMTPYALPRHVWLVLAAGAHDGQLSGQH